LIPIRLIIGLLAPLAIATLTVPLMAQSLVSGDIAGTVTDLTGAVLPNATVALKNDATGETRVTTTNSNGAYRISLLRPGTYSISASAQGFSKTGSKVNVTSSRTSVSDLKMSVGATTQTIEVTSAVAMVQADNADLSTTFSQSLIENIPDGGNDITYLAQSAPGVTMQTSGGYGNFTSHGLPAISNLFTVNGANAIDPFLNVNISGATNLMLGKNEVQEATVVNNAYSGQYGQQAGAQVSYVTKSGTNQFHGNAEYWWTGSSMDANDWFNTRNNTPRPFANNNQWAASVGGPIKKDKIFFFANNEGVRYIVPSSIPVFAPSPNFAAATLANLAVVKPNEVALYQRYFQIFQSAPGYNVTAAGSGDAGSPNDPSNECQGAGIPIVGNCIGQYQANPALPGTESLASGRIDANITSADHVFFRVKIDQGTQGSYADPINPAFNVASYQPEYDGQAQWSHVFGPNATNQLIVAGSYYRSVFTQRDPPLFPYGVQGNGINLTTVGGGPVYNYPRGRNVTQYQIVDDYSLSKGAHALKFGMNYRRYDITDYNFSVLINPLVLVNNLDAFYNGSSQQYRQRFPSRATQPVALWGMGIYGQDEWRLSKNLKLTLALRFEHNSNPVCQTDCSSLLNGNFISMVNAGLITADTPYNSIISGHRHQIYRETEKIDISPRFGFAWSPGSRGTTVVLGGLGIFYDALPAGLGDNFVRNLPGVVEERIGGAAWADTTAHGPAATATQSAAAIMSGFDSGASWSSLRKQVGSAFATPTFNNQAGTLHTPYYEQWSLGIQQQVGAKTSLSLSYVGNHGVFIPINNQGVNAFMNDNATGYNLAPFPTAPPTGCSNPRCTSSAVFGTVQQYSSSGISNFNGLTVNVNQRMTYGFSVQGSYTWSHTMDDVSNGGTGEFYNRNTSQQYQINPYCLRCNNYGSADYDIRHSFHAGYVWQTPFEFSNKFANGALGSWAVSQNFFARSGLPYSVLDGNSFIANFGPVSTMAQVIGPGQQGCSNGNSHCLNDTAFASATTTFPNQRRNGYRGPGFFDSDFTISKNFKLTERLAFGLGANFYNIFNHPNFSSPRNDIAAGPSSDPSGLGRITTTIAPPTGPYGSFFTGLPSGRIIQFQGKLVF
jgi:Carboxypeptidase regulatory-like domain/TonB dependent receptor